jgi:enoyl-CoA hydratase
VMGGGVGLSGYNTHRVAGETYSWAMPETMIGLFPDVGVCHALARLGPVGLYLALTGRSIKRADAFHLGLATHCIDSEHYAQIEAELALANTVDPLLDGLHRDPEAGELSAYGDVIKHAFEAPSVSDVVARLEAERGPHKAWAAAVAADLHMRSPLALEVTFRHVAAARDFDISQTLQADYRLACQFLEDPDFREGVRAALIDKDGAPSWQPARLDDVELKHLAPYFRPPDEPLQLASREDMQRARV